jgi:hypothetical protein
MSKFAGASRGFRPVAREEPTVNSSEAQTSPVQRSSDTVNGLEAQTSAVQKSSGVWKKAAIGAGIGLLLPSVLQLPIVSNIFGGIGSLFGFGGGSYDVQTQNLDYNTDPTTASMNSYGPIAVSVSISCCCCCLLLLACVVSIFMMEK